MARPIRIEPRVQLETTPVRLSDGELQRIVPRIRRSTHSSSQILRPRLVRRSVKCVGRRADLQNHGIQPECHRPIENSKELVLLLLCRETRLRRPINVLDRCDPNTSELAARRRRRCKTLYGIYLRLAASTVETGEHEK